MRVASTAFSDGETIPTRYTCDGENRSPALNWELAPSGTRSFVVLCDDADAPSGTWHHWAVYDIPSDRHSLAEGAAQQGRPAFNQAINDFKHRGYGGPCPPRGHGTHRYRFHLLALPTEQLPVSKNASCRDVERAARKTALAEAILTGLYERR